MRDLSVWSVFRFPDFRMTAVLVLYFGRSTVFLVSSARKMHRTVRSFQ